MYNNLLDMNASYNAGIYIRLSQEDKDKKYESDSESVNNQRSILKSYVETNGYTYIDEYVDDGYSGTNFDRPGFQRLINDILNKKVNLVIVKDLSRLGRDHVMTGHYIERFFPENKVRFISIMEGYDSGKNQASNDSSTFIVACNDYYSKQNSNKIRDVLYSKRKDGKFIGSKPCFGYMRDPEDKGHLIPDPNTADVVRNIFKWYSSGVGLSEIVTRLNDDGIPTPSKYKNQKKCSKCIYNDDWSISSVNKILKNRMYTGDMVQHTQTKVNYKSNKKITLDKKFWLIVENTHEALVDKVTFNSIQNMPARIPQTRTERPKRIFENLIFCHECGNFLTVNYKKKINYWSVNCNRYARDPKRRRCEPHFYPYEYLEEALLKKIKSSVKKYLDMIDAVDLNKELAKRTQKNASDQQTDLENLVKKRENLEKKIRAIYTDKLDGLITQATFSIMMEPLNKDLDKVKNEIIKNENKIKNDKAQISKIPDYTDMIREFLDIENPTRELISALIERIEIDKDRNIVIMYKFNLLDDDKFTYECPNLVRNPYGKKGKPRKE